MTSHEQIATHGSEKRDYTAEMEAAHTELFAETDALASVTSKLADHEAPHRLTTEKEVDDAYRKEVNADLSAWKRLKELATREGSLFAAFGAGAFLLDPRAGAVVGGAAILRGALEVKKFLEEHAQHLKKEDQLKMERIKIRARSELSGMY